MQLFFIFVGCFCRVVGVVSVDDLNQHNIKIQSLLSVTHNYLTRQFDWEI